jgi:hypothetical protein
MRERERENERARAWCVRESKFDHPYKSIICDATGLAYIIYMYIYKCKEHNICTHTTHTHTHTRTHILYMYIHYTYIHIHIHIYIYVIYKLYKVYMCKRYN